MQFRSHAEEAHVHHDHEGCCGDHGHEHSHGNVEPWLLSGTVLLISSFVASWVYPENKMVSDWLAVFAGIVMSLPILITAVKDLIAGHMHMDELVALAVLAAMVSGDYKTAAIVAFFMLISQLIETRTAHGAHAAIESLVKLSPADASRIVDGVETTIAANDLTQGDVIRVRPGENVPADGEIISGQTTLNEASITGESLPQDKADGAEVFAGTQNLTGLIDVRVSRVGEDTTIGKVKDLILAAERTKLPFTKVIDKYAGFYTPVVLMIALLVWFFTDDWSRLVALLVISCPCAFILATPTAMVAALSAAARHGILFKSVVDLEAASRINAIIFDKTGTLTNGELSVAKLNPQEGIQPSELLLAAATAEKYSNHPVAKAVMRLADEANVTGEEGTEFHEEAGYGVKINSGGESITCGRIDWLRKCGKASEQVEADHKSEQEGLSVLFVVKGDRYLGWIGLRDELRESAVHALADLKNLNIKKMAMITGDRSSVAERIAAEVGGLEYQAECLPSTKSDYVNGVKASGYKVAFVGDGVNDAPALAASDTGIAMGAAGSDVAIHSAKVALMNNDLEKLPFIIRLSRKSKICIFQNIGFGFVFIIGGLIFTGLGYINPILAAVMHNAGSLLVVFNSARLVRFGEASEDKDELDWLLESNAKKAEV